MSIKHIFSAFIIGLFCLQSGGCQTAEVSEKPSKAQSKDEQKRSEEQKKVDLLTQKILDKDPTAMLLAQQLGSFASSAIKPLTSSDDDIVRELALRSLNQSGGNDLEDVFVNALSDEMPSVRAAALNGLRNHLSPENCGKLLEAYDKVSDPQHRREIALLIGRLGNAKIDDLKKVCRDELESEARQGCLAALAKLGDPQARGEFLERLRAAEKDELKDFLELVDYIRQIWALRGLMPILGDKTPLAPTGFCQLHDQAKEGQAAAEEKITEFLRACDIAVNLIKKIAGAKFPFPTGAKNYADEELAAARQILAAVLSQQR